MESKVNCNLNHIIIAIDGVSASGKGSVAKLIAQHLNLNYLETGLLYRAVGYYMLKNKIAPNDVYSIAQLAKKIDLSKIADLNLQLDSIAQAASVVAKIPAVRANLLDKQQNFASNIIGSKQGVVLDGRDIGTVVCPNADIKFFLTADLNVRAHRRFIQLADQSNISEEQIYQSLKQRDENDSYWNNLAKAQPEVIMVDNSKLNLEETYKVFVNHIKNSCNLR